MPTLRMSLGGSEDATLPPAIQGRVTNGQRYFADFETYLIALHGFALVVDASDSDQASPYRTGDVVALGCKQSAEQWVWEPAVTVELLVRNISPTLAFIERMLCAQPPSHATLNLGALDALLYNFGQALATNFYERNLPQVKARFGHGSQTWPSVWNFGRVVRNAMSHGGRITFRNLHAPAVRWRTLQYSPADNGRQILHTDLWPGDLFNLILDMDAAI